MVGYRMDGRGSIPGTTSFHSAVTFSCSHTALDMCECQFSAVSMPNFLHVENSDMCRLYHISCCINSLPKWDILMLGSQQYLRILSRFTSVSPFRIVTLKQCVLSA
jgi:hypothetical protein